MTEIQVFHAISSSDHEASKQGEQQWLNAQGERWGECEPASWYVFSRTDALLNPDLARLLERHGRERPEIDIFYGDEAFLREQDPRRRYLFKPSFDWTQLIAQDYVGLPIAVRRRAMLALDGPDARAGSVQPYDLLLRAVTSGFGIERITALLSVNPQSPTVSASDDRLLAVRRHLSADASGYEVRPGMLEHTFELFREFEVYPDVTIVVPTCQSVGELGPARLRGRPLIISLLEGLRETDWPMERLRVLVGDDAENDGIYREQHWPFRLSVVRTSRGEDEPFNYAKKMNQLWRQTDTEQLVMMNDDIVIGDSAWLRALLCFSVDETVGGVGARLLFPDGTIQHAGMPAGVLGPCTHAFIGSPALQPTYGDWASLQREWSLVTGAVFATRRSVLEQAGGFDERLSTNYNDADLCLKLRMLGFRIVYTPHAELIHLESASRGKKPSPAEETALFMEKWRAFLRDDPAYHPQLTRSSSDIQPVAAQDAWWSDMPIEPPAEPSTRGRSSRPGRTAALSSGIGQAGAER